MTERENVKVSLSFRVVACTRKAGSVGPRQHEWHGALEAETSCGKKQVLYWVTSGKTTVHFWNHPPWKKGHRLDLPHILEATWGPEVLAAIKQMTKEERPR